MPGVAKYRVGILTILLLAGHFGTFSAAGAVEVATLYTARVAVDETEDDPRAAAYDRALAAVLMRVSGRELAEDAELRALLFPSPAAFVIQFRPGEEDTLWVTFDGAAIEKVLRQSGQTVWGYDRPLTLVWLAVDWGQGDREIIGADDPLQSRDQSRSIDRNRLLRQRVLDMAERRGLPIVFPLLDSDDLRTMSFSDLWGGFDEQLLAASGRYDVDSILVGRVRPASSQRNRWNYYFAGTERSFSGEPEQVVSMVADILADEFAISGDAPLQFVDLAVSGIDSVEAYGAMQSMLAGTNVIESFAVTEVSGDRIRYRVEAHGGAERLRRALRFNGLIEQNGFDGDRYPANRLDAPLEFFYSRQ